MTIFVISERSGVPPVLWLPGGRVCRRVDYTTVADSLLLPPHVVLRFKALQH